MVGCGLFGSVFCPNLALEKIEKKVEQLVIIRFIIPVKFLTDFFFIYKQKEKNSLFWRNIFFSSLNCFCGSYVYLFLCDEYVST